MNAPALDQGYFEALIAEAPIVGKRQQTTPVSHPPDGNQLAIEAGQQLLGHWLLNGRPDGAFDILSDDFQDWRHSRIHTAITALGQRGEPVGIFEVAGEIGKSDLDRMGGIAYLTSLSSNLLPKSGILGWTKIIIDTARAKKLRIHALSIISDIDTGLPVDLIEQRVREEFDGLAAKAITPRNRFKDIPTFNTVDCMLSTPPQREFAIRPFIPLGLIGVLNSMGGLGKSNFTQFLAAIKAAGRSVGPFVIDRPGRVVILNVEDGSDDIWRRLHAMQGIYQFSREEMDLIKENLIILPARGVIGAFMKLDGMNPVPSEYGLSLKAMLQDYQPELVIYDTKSRLFGLNENSNDDAAHWWRLIESTLVDHPKCSHMVVAHVSKAASDSNGQLANRGASAFIDNCRFNIVMQPMTDKEAEKFGVNRDQYFSVHLAKSNYSPASKPLYFRKEAEGVPVLEDVEKNSLGNAIEYLLEVIADLPDGKINQRDLLSRPAGKDIRQALKEEFSISKDGIKGLIESSIDQGVLETIIDNETSAGHKPVYLRVRKW